jgi:RNA polymerase sigma factor (sigma-70 family)
VNRRPYAVSRALDDLRASIVRSAMRLGLQRADAEDVAHTALLRLLSCQPASDPPTRGWARRAAHNGVVDLLRVAKRRLAREAAWLDAPGTPAQDPERMLVAHQAAACVESLPEALRSALLSCLHLDLSHQAAAEALGVPLGTVKTRIRLGLAMARRSMEVAKAPSQAEIVAGPKSETHHRVVIQRQVRASGRSRR